MLIGYGQPVLTPTIAGGAAANLQALVDGHPASIARISGGAGSVNLRADWASAVPVRIVAALGLTCPASTALTLTGKRAGDPGYTYVLGGNAATQTVIQLPDGSRAAWFVLPASNTPLVGLQLAIAANAFDIGELAVLQAVDVPHQIEWALERIDPSLMERTLGGGLNTVQRRAYRRLRASLTPAALADVRGAGLAGGMDWDALSQSVLGGARVAALPRWHTTTGALDPTELHRTAVYGVASMGGVGHLGGNYYDAGVTVDEVPPR